MEEAAPITKFPNAKYVKRTSFKKAAIGIGLTP